MTAMQLRGLDWMSASRRCSSCSRLPTVFHRARRAAAAAARLLRRDGRRVAAVDPFVFWLDSARCALACHSARNSAHRALPTAAPPPPQGFYSLVDIAGEVDNLRAFPLTVAVLEPTNALVNLLPLAVALSIDPNPRHYEVSYFSTLASRLAGGCEGRRSGGCWFGHLFFFAAMVSNLGNDNSQVVTAEKLVFFLESHSSAARRAAAAAAEARRAAAAAAAGGSPFFGTCSRGRRRRGSTRR